MLDRKRNIIIILSILCLLIILPPVMYGYIYPTGGDASAEHLKVIEQVTLTRPIPAQYLYAGQWIVGYPLVVLKTLFHIPLTTSFLWFNYLALIGIVLTFYFVFSKIFNRLAGIMSAVGIFMLQPFLLLFLSGAIFDIVSIGIIFTWSLYFGVRAWARHSWVLGIISALLLFLFVNFHFSMNLLQQVVQNTIQSPTSQSSTSVGITSILQYIGVVLVCGGFIGLIIRFRKLIFQGATKDGKLMMICLGVVGITLVVVPTLIFKLSIISSRTLLDGEILIFLLAMSALSLYVMNTATSKKQIDAMVAIICLVTAIMWLPTWFSYNSAIKPVDKQAIEYVNSLEGRQFYGNEYVAHLLYGQYLNKTYEPKSNIYIWRSEPMTGHTDPHSEWWWNPKAEDVTQLDNMKVLATFEDKGVEIYVAQSR